MLLISLSRSNCKLRILVFPHLFMTHALFAFELWIEGEKTGSVRECLHRKARTGASFTPGWLPDFVSRLHAWWLGTRQFFHHPTCNVLRLTKPSWIDKNYACATRSSLPANRIHTETSGHFAFTWYRCEISYRSEILAPVQEPGWTHAGATRAGMTSCGGIM